MPVAEALLGPDIDATLFREPCGERGHCQRRGYEEEGRGQQPQRDRDRASVCGGGQPANADDGGDVEQDQVTEAEFAAQVGFGGGVLNRAECTMACTRKRGEDSTDRACQANNG